MRSRGREEARQAVSEALAQHRNVKLNIVALAHFNRINQQENEEPLLHMTRGFGTIVHNIQSFETIYDRELERAAQRLQDFEDQGSGFTISSVSGFYLNIYVFKPLKGGSYIPTPASIKQKRAVVNVKNLRDHNCLKHALSTGLMYHRGNVNRSPRGLVDIDPVVAAEIDLTGLDLPILVQDMPRVEEKNPRLAINVLVMHQRDKVKDISVLRVSPRLYQEDTVTINLLLIYNDKADGHYVYVKDLNSLMASTKFRTRGAKFCIKCQQFFYGPHRKANFEAHLPCNSNFSGRISFPSGDVRFKRYGAQMRSPWVIYGDFESKLVPPTTTPPKTEPKLTSRSSHYRDLLKNLAFPDWYSNPPPPLDLGAREGRGQEEGAGAGVAGPGGMPMEGVLEAHELISYTLAVVGPSQKHNCCFAYTGPEVKQKLVQDLYRIRDMIDNHRADPTESEIPMQMTWEDEAKFQAATECFLCHEKFGHPYLIGMTVNQLFKLSQSKKAQSSHPNRPNYVPSYILKGPKVRDHNHDTGLKKRNKLKANLNFI